MEKSQSEARQPLKGKDKIEELEYFYLKLVIKETFRLHPAPAVGPVIPRLARAKVIINAYAIGRDSKLWADHPENAFKTMDFKGNNFELLPFPFGAGRRLCRVISFELPLHTLNLDLLKYLYHLDWKLANRMKLEALNHDD
ncbi:hypothetical protein ACFXTH_028165 [Malus domestica]